jgi:hypothetical protein
MLRASVERKVSWVAVGARAILFAGARDQANLAFVTGGLMKAQAGRPWDFGRLAGSPLLAAEFVPVTSRHRSGSFGSNWALSNGSPHWPGRAWGHFLVVPNASIRRAARETCRSPRCLDLEGHATGAVVGPVRKIGRGPGCEPVTGLSRIDPRLKRALHDPVPGKM